MNNLFPFDLFEKKYQWPTASALRSYYNRREKLGLDGAFFRLGKRILVDPEIFFNAIRLSNLKKLMDKQND